MKTFRKLYSTFCITLLISTIAFQNVVYAGAGSGGNETTFSLEVKSGENNLCKWATLPIHEELDINEDYYALQGRTSEGLAVVINTRTEKMGYCDLKGKTVITAKFDDAGEFLNGYAWVNNNGREGLIDKKGKIILPIDYDWVGSYSEGLIRTKKDGKISYLNINGKTVFVVKADHTNNFSNGLAEFNIGKKHGFINKKGSVVIKPIYDEAYSFTNGYAAVKKDGKWGFINTSGKMVIALRKADGVLNYNNGLLGFYLNSNKNENEDTLQNVEYVNISGKTILKLKNIVSATNFSMEYALVTKYDSNLEINEGYIYGYTTCFVDKTGKEIPFFNTYNKNEQKTYISGLLSSYSNGIAVIKEYIPCGIRDYIIEVKK